MINITGVNIFHDRLGTKLSINYATMAENGDVIVDNNTRMMNVVDDEIIKHIDAIEETAKAYIEEAENE